jgi:O-6-methylguanine DNA methyltransferase
MHIHTQLSFGLFDTVLGWMGIIGSTDGLREIILPRESTEDVLCAIKGQYNELANTGPDVFGDLPQRLRSYLNGEQVSFPDRLDFGGATHFQRTVWRTAQTIPYGETRSYSWVASRSGCDKGARAAGLALGRNPLPIIIPCHRVISNDGSLGGFTGGLSLKKYLLHLEAAGMQSV